MRAKQLELDTKKNQLADLERDFKAVAEQLRVEGNARSRNRLEVQREKVGRDMEQLEQKIRELEAEIQQEPLTRLVEIVEAHADRFPDMMPSYQATIAYWHWSPNPQPKTSSEIIVALQKIPQGQSPYSAVEQFVDALVSQTQDISLLGQLQNWGEQQVKNWAELRSWVENRQEQQRQAAKSAVMVKISLNQEASTQGKESRYQIEAHFVQDIDRYRIDRREQGSPSYKPIHLPGTTGEETYSLEDLSTQVPQLVISVQQTFNNEASAHLEIHIFLPLELMNQDVDCWMFHDTERPLGHEYNVVLRYAERLSRNYRKYPNWVDKWQHHQDLLQECALQAFVSGDNQHLRGLPNALNDVDQTIVGLKVIQAPLQVERGGIFEVLYWSGLPLAIWGRCNLTNSCNETELDQVLRAAQRLELLPDQVQRTRCAALEHEQDCHIGHHLSLLWDDPYLVPPKSA